MGKGSKPRNNHSSGWFANYDDINWKKDTGPVLTDEQLELYLELERDALDIRGPKLTKSQEATLLDHVRKAFPKK